MTGINTERVLTVAETRKDMFKKHINELLRNSYESEVCLTMH